MKKLIVLVVLLASCKGEYYTQEHCENLFWTPAVNDAKVVNACAEAWGRTYIYNK